MRGSRMPSPQFAVAAVALLLALGGTSYAAVGAPDVTTAMKAPVTKATVVKLIKKYVAANPGVLAGPQGPQGPPGTAGTNGTNGTNGTPGASFYDPIPAGKTMRGLWSISGDPSAAAIEVGDYIQFPAPIPAGLVDGPFNAPTANKGIGVKDPAGNPTMGGFITDDNEDPGCDGTYLDPTAPAGRLCVYIRGGGNIAGNSVTVFSPEASGVSQVARLGFIMSVKSFGAGHLGIEGSWAYRAP